jgi:hypothetical protein
LVAFRIIAGCFTASALVSVANVAIAAQGNFGSATGTFGARATVGGVNNSVPSQTATLSGVRVQDNSATALVQIGQAKFGSAYANGCGPASTIGFLVESFNSGGANYVCTTYFGGYGAAQLFSVSRSGASATLWNVYVGTFLQAQRNVSFGSGIAASVAEYIGPGGAPTSYNFSWNGFQRQLSVGSGYGNITLNNWVQDPGFAFSHTGAPPNFTVFR